MPNPVMLKPIVAIAMLAALTGCASRPMPVSQSVPVCPESGGAETDPGTGWKILAERVIETYSGSLVDALKTGEALMLVLRYVSRSCGSARGCGSVIRCPTGAVSIGCHSFMLHPSAALRRASEYIFCPPRERPNFPFSELIAAEFCLSASPYKLRPYRIRRLGVHHQRVISAPERWRRQWTNQDCQICALRRLFWDWMTCGLSASM